MSPEDTIAAYRSQVNRRAKLFAVAALIGIVVALALDYVLDVEVPIWEVALIVHGIIFWPFFFKQTLSKQHVSTREALRCHRELKQKSLG